MNNLFISYLYRTILNVDSLMWVNKNGLFRSAHQGRTNKKPIKLTLCVLYVYLLRNYLGAGGGDGCPREGRGGLPVDRHAQHHQGKRGGGVVTPLS